VVEQPGPGYRGLQQRGESTDWRAHGLCGRDPSRAAEGGCRSARKELDRVSQTRLAKLRDLMSDMNPIFQKYLLGGLG
jgi:hypothetical protein